MRATKPEIVNAAVNVVAALRSLESSEKAEAGRGFAASYGTTQRYRDHLDGCIYRLKFLIERDNPSVIRELK